MMLTLMLKSILLLQKRRPLCRRSQGLQKEKKKPKRTPPPAVRKETPPSSSYEDTDDEDDEDDEDGEDVAGHGIRGKKPIAAMVRLHHDSDDHDDTGEESDVIDSNHSRGKEATPRPHKKKQRRLYEDAVENRRNKGGFTRMLWRMKKTTIEQSGPQQ